MQPRDLPIEIVAQEPGKNGEPQADGAPGFVIVIYDRLDGSSPAMLG